MIKVLIVDDDSISRTSIKTLIDWNKHGFEICGEAANGENGLETIKEQHPHIVITDMSMPVMNGVEFIDYLNKNYPNIKVIALSGYDQYDYVRQSMKKGAVDYILKHTLNAEALLNVLKTACDLIRNERMENDNRNKMEKALKESISEMKQKFIRELVSGGFDDIGEVKQKISDLGLSIDMSNLIVVAVELDNFHHLKEKLTTKGIKKIISSFMEISTEILNDMGNAFITNIEEEKFAMLFTPGNLRSCSEMHNNVFASINRIKECIKRYLNITACFSISSTIVSIMDVHKYYVEAEKNLKNKFFKGKDSIFQENIVTNKRKEILTLDMNDEKTIIEALKFANREKLQECIKNIFNPVILNEMSQASIGIICVELINIVNRIARESGINIKDIYSDGEIPYEEMKKYETINEVRDWILSVYERVLKFIEISEISSDYSEPTRKAISFIHKNYSSNISLNDAAEEIGVNSSYLSRIFKKDCGIGFNEYLNHIRVEHAKWFIENRDFKLKDITKRVGFNSYTYFFTVFKEFIGITPQEYEDIVVKKVK
ncbi:response regulator transcription factor [Clostridium thermarum]|uniref:response regulator transcription factor n=1 Tax=Clostridium thermarum TaxID=1716543 RepID=UPI00111E3407|nr:response regulator [Clostridium thermarum]